MMPLLGEPFTILKSVDSTNNYAMAQVHAGLANHGSAYLAMEQTGGKGQRGKTWNSAPGENILLTVIVTPEQFSMKEQFLLSAAVALACHDLVGSICGIETTIKWPNDIYWRDRKAGGILIENVFRGSDWQAAVIGTGINVNQYVFPEAMAKPVSFKQITGKSFEVIPLAKQLCNLLQLRLKMVQQGDRLLLLDQYNAVLYRRGQLTRFRYENSVFNGIVHGVSAEGRLILQTDIKQEFDWGTIEWQ